MENQIINQESHTDHVSRIVGQIQAIHRKLDEPGYEVSTVVQQIEAVRGSLKSLEKKLLYAKMQQTSDTELCKCLEYILKIID